MLPRFTLRALPTVAPSAALCRWATLPHAPVLAHFRPLSTSVSMAQIKELREKTAAPIGECKKALEASDGSLEKAFDWLRAKGAAKASQMTDRVATEGLVGVVLDGDNEAAMVQVTCETDFSARNETMQGFVAAVARACLDRVPLPPAPGVHSVTLDALLAQPLDPSVSSVDHAKATPGTSLSVKDALGELVGKIRENISVKQAAKAASFTGVVGVYVHGASAANPTVGSAGALVSISAAPTTGGGGEGTAVVSLSPEALETLRPLARRLAMHAVAAKPRYLDVGDIPESALEHEKALQLEMASGGGKAPAIVEKMVEGRLRKFYGEVALLHQPHLIEEGAPPVKKVLETVGKSLGLSLTLDGFALYSGGN